MRKGCREEEKVNGQGRSKEKRKGRKGESEWEREKKVFCREEMQGRGGSEGRREDWVSRMIAADKERQRDGKR